MTPADIVANLLAWSLQIGAVAAAAALLPSAFRLDVAGVRYAYWRSVALLCLALPWIQLSPSSNSINGRRDDSGNCVWT